jgi:hypothetical protein
VWFCDPDVFFLLPADRLFLGLMRNYFLSVAGVSHHDPGRQCYGHFPCVTCCLVRRADLPDAGWLKGERFAPGSMLRGRNLDRVGARGVGAGGGVADPLEDQPEVAVLAVRGLVGSSTARRMQRAPSPILAGPRPQRSRGARAKYSAPEAKPCSTPSRSRPELTHPETSAPAGGVARPSRSGKNGWNGSGARPGSP